MGLRDLMQNLGFWTDVFKWSEPAIVRVRVRGDWWLRLAIALGAGGAGTCLLLVLFAINQRPPNPLFALIGGGVAFVIVASFLFHAAGSASGRVRMCQEGIQRKRNYVGFGVQMFEEANWPYEAIEQCVIVPGQALGKSFSVLLVGGGGEWELVGVPRKIDLHQLAGFLQSRQLPVSSANYLPEHFTRPINLPVSLAVAALGFMLFVGGLGFYAIQTAGAPGANVAQAGPPNIPQPPIENPNRPPPPPAAVNNPPVQQPVNAAPPPAAPGFQGFGDPFVPPNPPEVRPAAPGPAIPDRPAAANPPGPRVAVVANVAGRDTEVVGGKGGFPFRAGSQGGEPLIGFAWSSGNWGGKKTIGRLEPLFSSELPPGLRESVLAKEGYAIGGIRVEGDDFVRAIQVVFVKIAADGKLDPADSYASDWIGHPAGEKVQAIDGGAKVVGIQGRKAAILDAVGLVLAE